MRIVCLHGFLGLPSDFDFLGPGLKRRGLFIPTETIDLWSCVPKSFDEVVQTIAKRCDETDVLLGYSMGGRIASSAFLQGGACDRGGLVVVSAHCRGIDPKEAETRTVRDALWASRFETDNWDDLISDWCAQGVFKGDGPTGLKRPESRFNRTALAHALRAWSVVHQRDARSELGRSVRPVLWMAGEHDQKYAGLTRRLTSWGENIETLVIDRAGHRLPWSAEEKFMDALCSFLRRHFVDRHSE